MSTDPSEKSLTTKISEQYGDKAWLRAIVQTVPYVGGSIDTLLTSEGQKYRESRIADYISEIASRIEGLESKFENLILTQPEETFDLLRSQIESVDRCRSHEKRKRFANILLNQIDSNSNWDEPETASRILGDLTQNHVAVLQAMCSAPKCVAPFEGIRVSVIEPLDMSEKGSIQCLTLTSAFKDIPAAQLRLIVVELLSRGLVKDEGVGRFGARAMEKFSSLDAGQWLLSWIERGV